MVKSYRDLYFKAYFIIGLPEDTRKTLMETYDMVKEITVDETHATNLMPFPGTAVFEQVLRDNLFIEEFDVNNLWRTDGFNYADNKFYCIKPYQLELDELREFRNKFDTLLSENKRKKSLEQCHV